MNTLTQTRPELEVYPQITHAHKDTPSLLEEKKASWLFPAPKDSLTHTC